MRDTGKESLGGGSLFLETEGRFFDKRVPFYHLYVFMYA
jgi:hypothetical protein